MGGGGDTTDWLQMNSPVELKWLGRGEKPEDWFDAENLGNARSREELVTVYEGLCKKEGNGQN